MLAKIISGGQTGADTGGLLAGKALCLDTGGTAPHNWMTEKGSQKEFLLAFGLEVGEYDRRVYPKRTEQNIRDSDATIVFGDITSPGSKLTINLCIGLRKPYKIEIDSRAKFRRWIKNNSIKILNVAGNRESKNPGIQARVCRELIDALYSDVIKM